MLVKGEGLTRLEAERRLVKRYKDEYERLARRRGHVHALQSLVKAHKNRYNTLVREAREVRRAWGPEAQTDSTEAA
jgi:hypothetical protein